MIAPAPNLSEVLSKVQHVELRALRALDSTRAGHFRSVFLGHGMEFDQVREYVPGDDLRQNFIAIALMVIVGSAGNGCSYAEMGESRS